MEIQNDDNNNDNNSEKADRLLSVLLISAFSVFTILVVIILIWAGIKNKSSNNKVKQNNNVVQTQAQQDSVDMRLVFKPKKPYYSPDEPFNFVIVRKYLIKGNPSKVDLTVGLPSNIKGRQQISNLTVLPEAKRTADNSDKARIILKDPRELQIIYRGIADTHTYTIERAKKSNTNIDGVLSKDDFIRYTKPEKGIESNDILVRKLARSIPDGENREGTIKNIFDFVVGYLKYDTTVLNSDRGAFFAASNAKGTCTEYASLFVALCRVKNIPARVVRGFYLPFEDNVMSEYPSHAWAEVYFDEYGWVNFDPSIYNSPQMFDYIKENNLSFYDMVNVTTAKRRYLTINYTDIYMQYETKKSFPVSITNLGDKISFSKVNK